MVQGCLERKKVQTHVNPYGVFKLDLNTRLPIDEAVRHAHGCDHPVRPRRECCTS